MYSQPETGFAGRRCLWISWERHRRTLEICRHTAIPLCILESRKPRLLKHPWFVLNTTWILLRQRPQVLFVQNPSVVLTLLAVLLRPLLRYRLVVDAHNGGLSYQGLGGRRHRWLYRFLKRHADITIVTNQNLARKHATDGGSFFVLPDRIPEAPVLRKAPLQGKYNLMLICTFEADEPWREVLSSVSSLSGDFYLYVTGRYEKIPEQQRAQYRQVEFTGFLSEPDYWNLLYSVDVVIDLTLREDCLVCGAYEAVAVETPGILSDFQALREYFFQGFVFTANDRASITSAIKQAVAERPRLKQQIAAVKEKQTQNWNEQIGRLAGQLRP